MTQRSVLRWRWRSSGQTGLIHAASELQAIRMLTARGMQNIAVHPERFFKTKAPSTKEWLVTIEQWLELLECGLPLPDALRHSITEHSSRQMTWLVNDCKATISQGYRFSAALQQYSDWLSTTDVHTIEWAEASGQLVQGLNNILTLRRQQRQMKENLTKALRYPLIVGAVASSVALLMMTWVLPQFQALFGDAHLPAFTQQVLAVSEFVGTNALSGVTTIAALYITCCVIRYRFPYAWRRFTLRLPLLRRLIIGVREQHIYFQLGLSLEAGLDAVRAFRLTIESLDCPVYKSRLTHICQNLENGFGWSHAFSLSPLNTPKTMSFIQAAEKSGRIAHAFKQLAKLQQKQLNVYSERLSTYAQPLLMLILGGIIGTLLIAMYLPLFSLGEQF